MWRGKIAAGERLVRLIQSIDIHILSIYLGKHGLFGARSRMLPQKWVQNLTRHPRLIYPPRFVKFCDR